MIGSCLIALNKYKKVFNESKKNFSNKKKNYSASKKETLLVRQRLLIP